MNYFKKTDLPMNKEMINFWNENGYLVIEDFNSSEECDKIIERSSYLIDNNNLNNQKSIFDTINQSHNDDSYFLDSGDKIRFFFEVILFTFMGIQSMVWLNTLVVSCNVLYSIY